MTPAIATYGVLLLSVFGYLLGLRWALRLEAGRVRAMHSRPYYHGMWVALCMLLPAVIFLLAGLALKSFVPEWIVVRGLPADYMEGKRASLVAARLWSIANEQFGVSNVQPLEQAAADRLVWLNKLADWIIGLGALVISILMGLYALRPIDRAFQARNATERIFLWILIACSAVAILTTVGIVFTLIFDSLRFFAMVSPTEFFFGLNWRPITAIREGQLGQEGSFGFIPVLVGTTQIAMLAMLVAGPIGLFSAIYMVEFAPHGVRSTAKPVIEVLAGIPTVVYGFFAATLVAPLVRDFGESLGIPSSSESALAAGAVMGIMIIPFVSSLSDDVISSVPGRLRQAAYSLGATRGETIVRVVLPAALPGLVSAMVLATSRAIGETMIVVMAAGLAANLTLNPFEAVTTITVQITTVLTGDQPFDSPMTLSAFALALALFAITLMLNLFALQVMERYRDQYD
ncbi:phosphate ABC transporter permease subunit PstC [Roseovarius salinarum]|uniref:phosphate ABC transporter permease subunit PstC n=1 Tax=Roseovarius salinarum TaxID=1981892 RepID=UPI000C326DA0|nr:phosphate ABC transporter permease subunit PstC [Roseovarius salinarum]